MGLDQVMRPRLGQNGIIESWRAGSENSNILLPHRELSDGTLYGGAVPIITTEGCQPLYNTEKEERMTRPVKNRLYSEEQLYFEVETTFHCAPTSRSHQRLVIKCTVGYGINVLTHIVEVTRIDELHDVVTVEPDIHLILCPLLQTGYSVEYDEADFAYEDPDPEKERFITLRGPGGKLFIRTTYTRFGGSIGSVESEDPRDRLDPHLIWALGREGHPPEGTYRPFRPGDSFSAMCSMTNIPTR